MGFFNNWLEGAKQSFSEIGDTLNEGIAAFSSVGDDDKTTKEKFRALSDGVSKVSTGVFSGLVNTVTLGTLGDDVNNGLKRGHERNVQGKDLIAQGDVAGGIQRRFLGLMDTVVNTATFGLVSWAGKNMDDMITERDENGRDYNTVTNFVMNIYQNGRDFNENVYDMQVKALEEGDLESAKALGGTALKKTGMSAAGVVLTVGGIVITATGAGAPLGTALGKAGLMVAGTATGVAGAGVQIGSAYQSGKFNKSLSDAEFTTSVMSTLDEFREYGYEFTEQQEKDFEQYTKLMMSGSISEEDYNLVLEHDILVPNTAVYTHMYEDMLRENYENGELTEDQYHSLAYASALYDIGELDDESYSEKTDQIMAGTLVMSADEKPERKSLAGAIMTAGENGISMIKEAAQEKMQEERVTYPINDDPCEGYIV